MSGPVLLQNVQIIAGSVRYESDGTTPHSTTFTLTPMPGGTLLTGSIQMEFPGLVNFAIGSTYQLSLTAS